MRIDKYLWCIRMYKTRTVATEACKQGKVRIQDAIVKPSREVYIGDRLLVRKNQINYELEVLDLPKSRLGAKLVDIYRKDVTPKEALQKLDLLNYSKDYNRKKGTGRPTKKDRREIDDWFEQDSEDTPKTEE